MSATPDIYIMLGADEELLPRHWTHHKEALWIGVDYGAIRLIREGIRPLLSIGDFDSVNRKEAKNIRQQSQEVITLQSEKDYTDAEAAIHYAIEHYPESTYYIYGGTGGRMDHGLSILLIPLQKRFNRHAKQFILVDRNNEIRYYRAGTYEMNQKEGMEYLAFGTFESVEGLTLKNVKYELDATDLEGPYIFTSNEFVEGPAQFSFKSGSLITIQSRDQ